MSALASPTKSSLHPRWLAAAPSYLAVLTLAFLSPAMFAQTISAPSQPSSSPGKLPEFDVATIRPIDPNKPHTIGVTVEPGGRIRIQAFNLKGLICAAFHLSYWQLSGGEDWTEKLQYDVTALPPESFRATNPDTGHAWEDIEDEHLRQMLQALLMDRFQLHFHRETKTGTVYLLEQKGKTSALHLSDTPGGYNEVGWAGSWVITNSTMPQIANFAGKYILHASVTDRTGISGAFNYRGPQEDPGTHNTHDEIDSFLVMLQDIGLKLTPSKGPIETFVIDHAEKPSAN